ncbi:MAG TPA: hypothetical protein VHW60_01225 [Caulobacteraceae bacterium]|jgi:hypothetical protein|nr:hypothetical protein [Caulobacteraceae bacterium]
MKAFIVAGVAALSGIVCGAADAQGSSGVNCISYKSLSGGAVHGAVCRGSTPGVWQEINTQNDGAVRWQETSEAPGRVTLFDASRNYTLIIDAKARQVLIQSGPNASPQVFYSIASVE